MDVGIAILKFANSDVGQLTIKLTLAITTVTMLVKALKGLEIVNLVKDTMALQTALASMSGVAITSTQAFSASIGILTKQFLKNAAAWAMTPMGMGTIAVGAIIAIKAAYDHFNVTLDEQVDKLKEVNSTYEEAQTKTDSLEQQLENVRDRIEEINSKDNLELTDETQLRMLQEEETSLENQLLLQKELARVAKEEATAEAKKTLQRQVTDAGAFGFQERNVWNASGLDLTVKEAGTGTVTEALASYTQQLNEAQDEIDELLAKKQQLVDANQTESEEYNQLNSDIAQAISTRDSLRDSAVKYADIVSTAITNADQENEVIKEAVTTFDLYGDALERINGAQENQTDKTQESTESNKDLAERTEEVQKAIDKLVQSLKLSNSQLERYQSLMDNDSLLVFLQRLEDIRSASDDASDGIDNLQEALENAITAQAEYTANGALTLDTFQSLIGISADYLVALQNENGQLEINQTTLSNLVDKMKVAKIEELQSAAAADIMAYSTGQVSEMSDYAKGIVETLGNNIETAGKQANNAGTQMVQFAVGVSNAIKASGGTVDWDDSGVQAIMAGYRSIAGEIASLTIDTTRYGNESAKAHSKSSNSTKKEKSALDELKDKYKDVIDFIKDQYDEQIDAIEEAKDKAIDAIDDQIDAINDQIDALDKEKETRLESIDAEIDALEKQRDAREEYWNVQLELLEKENKAREDNIKLREKQESLAKSQQSKVMILKDGRFQYGTDEAAVSSAQQELEDFYQEQEYERQKEQLENLKNAELDNYDQRIDNLKAFIDKLQDYYEDRKQQLENQKQQLEDQKDYLQDYYDEQVKMLEDERDAVNEILENGVVDQQAYWDKMISQLNSFVSDWNKVVGAMSFPDISGSGIKLSQNVVKAKSTGDNKVSAYASGKGSIGDSEIAVVGENPKYRELVIGSKLNNDQGVVMSLKRGSGVVNAGATNTLASIFNSLNGQKSVGQPVSNSSQSMSIQIGSISLPEVKDGQGFVDYLQNFSADITQQSFRRA